MAYCNMNNHMYGSYTCILSSHNDVVLGLEFDKHFAK